MSHRSRQTALLAAIMLTTSLIWLVVLPYCARWESIRLQTERQRAQGIDPSAMFYSEVEAMPEIWRRQTIAATSSAKCVAH